MSGWADQHIITDSAKDTREMVITMPGGGIDMLTFEHKLVVNTTGGTRGMARTADPVSLDREAAKRLFAILGMFLHGWEESSDE